jgi:hypothetical protein
LKVAVPVVLVDPVMSNGWQKPAQIPSTAGERRKPAGQDAGSGVGSADADVVEPAVVWG